MAKIKTVQTRSAVELAKSIGLSRAHALEWEVQSVLLQKLVGVVKKRNLTHAEIAKRAQTSRTRITSILNGNLHHVSTDLLIRILGSLGYEISITVARSKLVA